MQEIADTVSEYSPTIGRFLQRDTLGCYDSMNFQQFVFNSPNNYVDPYGLAGFLGWEKGNSFISRETRTNFYLPAHKKLQ